MTNAVDDPGPPRFDLAFDGEPGRLAAVSPLVRRIVADNPSPFTFRGTNTYVVGRGAVAVIDPGPPDEAHVAALLDALKGERVDTIVVTHSHRDHSPGARLLKQATGAPIVGCGVHRPARALAEGETARLEAANDLDHLPDRELKDGEATRGEGWELVAVATPGHTMNHLAFHLTQENALFSGDHVMGWSTSVVAPPDGAMGPYMASLERLRTRDDLVYWPGHGGPVREPQRFVRALIGHRRQREAAILARLAERPRAISELVALNYAGLAPRLKGAAALSTLAHLEDLADRGLARFEGVDGLSATWRVA
ncbi:MAG: MBL fold metallo-hydrolase [Rhodoblastus sp.]|nr:MAG: MBL fold metallo-hydrolase [Rhodoblastus sp.]